MDKSTSMNDIGFSLRYRMSLRELETPKFKDQRYAFLKALHKIKNLPAENKDSFWSLASINGQPFNKIRTAPPQSDKVWGGYSQHENVLFLPWYRAYLLYFENALFDAAPDNEKALIALPYWDATTNQTLANGFPDLALDEYVTIDDNGNQIPNPLLSYTLPEAIPVSESSQKYTKPKGYITVRYPFSGLNDSVGEPLPATKTQNYYLEQGFRNPKIYLQQNVIYSLTARTPSIRDIFENSLQTNTYNAFSNELSAKLTGQTSLETACIQSMKTLGGGTKFDLLAGANGDIGSNETAAFDPMFFLLMANIDRVFWAWQKKYQMRSSFTIDTNDPNDQGIKPKNGQGPAPNQSGDTTLTNTSKLFPFKVAINQANFTDVNGVMDIETQLKYTYSKGSLEECKAP